MIDNTTGVKKRYPLSLLVHRTTIFIQYDSCNAAVVVECVNFMIDYLSYAYSPVQCVCKQHVVFMLLAICINDKHMPHCSVPGPIPIEYYIRK